MKRIFFLAGFFVLIASGFVFSDEVSVSARLSDSEIGSESQIIPIEVEYLIPQDMYQSHNPDFFYFTVEGIEDMVQGVIKYPKGKVKDGTTVYLGRVILTSNILIPFDLPPGSYILHVNAGYQLCDINDMCYFPEEKTILLEFEY